MRLLDTSTLRLVTKREGDIPAYAILSHTWGVDDEEVSFQDIQRLSSSSLDSLRDPITQSITQRAGFTKIRDSALLAKSQGYQFIWIDTCCIDKTSSAELSEAINSMFRWYQGAAICYAFLNDVGGYSSQFSSGALVPPGSSEMALMIQSIKNSRWFTRGWTLQELVAPSNVYFYAQDWSLLGAKLGDTAEPLISVIGFPQLLAQITGIDLGVLDGSFILDDLSVAMRMKWAAKRQTTRTEDLAYCLMGIFNVNMPLLYGEGDRAFMRLQEEILKATDDQSIFAWKCPEDDMLRYQLSGLLALKPAYFEDFGDIKPLPPDPLRASAPSTMTNAGLHVQLDLRKLGNDESQGQYYAILNCYPRERREDESETETVSYFLVIRLAALSGDQHARLNPDSVFWVSDYQTGVRLEGDGERYIYVKQLPTYGLPEIVATGVDSESFLVDDAYPHSKWNPRTQVLKPETSARKSLGVFRILVASDRILHDRYVDVFVGMSPEQLGPLSWRCWCFLQEPSRDSITDQILPLSDQDEPVSSRYSSSHVLRGIAASVETTRMRSRVYISLKLSEVYELHGRATRTRPRFVPPPGDVHELEAISMREPNWLSSISTFGDSLVTEDAWQSTLGLPDASTGEEILPQVRTWIQGRAGTRNQRSDSLRNIFARASRADLKVENPGTTEASAFENYFSLLLVRACRNNNRRAVNELLDSPLSAARLEVSTSIKADRAEPWHDLIRGFRPLHWATALEHIDIVRLLIDRDAVASSFTHYGLSAVHLAVMLGHTEILHCLLHATRDLQPQWFNKHTQVESPAHLAAGCILSSDVEEVILKLMFDNVAGENTPDFNSFLGGSREQYFLHYGPDMRYMTGMLAEVSLNKLRETPLHRAAAMNNIHAAECILSNSVTKPTLSRDSSGRTPLWHAAATGALGTLALLLAKGAAVDASDRIGRTPLHAACRMGHLEIVEELLGAGANVNAVTHGLGLTACHFAVIGNHAEVLKTIIEGGADPNHALTGEGMQNVCPVHTAATNGFLQCTEVLVEAQCDISKKASHHILIQPSMQTRAGILMQMLQYKQEPSDLASWSGHQVVARILRSARGGFAG